MVLASRPHSFEQSLTDILGPSEDLVGQIRDFQKLFLAPGFLAYIGVLITASLVIIFYFAPR